jgi:malate permease and related proteins
MADVNYIFFLSLGIITIGFLFKNLKKMEKQVIAKIIFNFTLPAVILRITTTIEFKYSLILLPIINISFGVFMAFIGLIVFKKYPKKLKGLLLMTLIGFNVAHFSFPLIEGIYGQEGLQYIALIDAGNAFTVFLICYIFGSIYSHNSNSDKGEINVKKTLTQLAKSAPLITYIFALILNLSGAIFPVFFLDLVTIISYANTPLSLLLLGIYLDFSFKKSEWLNILKVVILRYVIGLSIGLLLFFFLPKDDFTHLIRLIIMISLILPVGLAVIPFSVEFEYDQELTTMITNISIVISFILIWIIILLFDGFG